MFKMICMVFAVNAFACGEVSNTPVASTVDPMTTEEEARGIMHLSRDEIQEAVEQQLGPVPEPVEEMVQAPIVVEEPVTQDLSESGTLLDIDMWNHTAPASYRVRLNTTAGSIVMQVHKEWAPIGADRFYNMVLSGYLTDVAFFRVIPGFVAQGGMHGDVAINDVWSSAHIDDDSVQQSNTRGRVTFATSGPDSRTTQFFINFADNSRLDAQGFAPFAEVVEGLEVVDAIYSGYAGTPNQGRIGTQGDSYLRTNFPELTRIMTASLE